jgi:DNA-binding MarR family transcriptional regulator
LRLKKAEKKFRLTTSGYARLAAFRKALREFLRFSDAAAAKVGLSTQHYQAMLVLRACPAGQRISIRDLADQLLIKHNSAVGLVDRLVQEGLVAREASTADRRKVQLVLSQNGREVLALLASMHRRELKRIGPMLAAVVADVSGPKGKSAG